MLMFLSSALTVTPAVALLRVQSSIVPTKDKTRLRIEKMEADREVRRKETERVSFTRLYVDNSLPLYSLGSWNFPFVTTCYGMAFIHSHYHASFFFRCFQSKFHVTHDNFTAAKERTRRGAQGQCSCRKSGRCGFYRHGTRMAG